MRKSRRGRGRVGESKVEGGRGGGVEDGKVEERWRGGRSEVRGEGVGRRRRVKSR